MMLIKHVLERRTATLGGIWHDGQLNTNINQTLLNYHKERDFFITDGRLNILDRFTILCA